MFLGLSGGSVRPGEWDGVGELLRVSPSVIHPWARDGGGLSQTAVLEIVGVCRCTPSFCHTYSWSQQASPTEFHLVP